MQGVAKRRCQTASVAPVVPAASAAPALACRRDLADVTVREAAYYAAFFCFCLAIGLSLLSASGLVREIISQAISLLQFMTSSLLLASIVMQRYSVSQAGLLLVVGVVALVSGYRSGDLNLVWIFLFVLAGREAQLRTLAKVAFACYVMVLVLALVGVGVGVLGNVVLFRDGSGARYSMGFRHPNQFGLVVFELCLALVICRFPRFTLTDYVGVIVGFSSVLVIANSRTSALGIGLLVVVMLLSKSFLRRDARGTLRMFIVMFVVVVGASLYFMACYNPENGFHRFLNTVLSGRLYYMHYYFENYPLTLFGFPAHDVVAVYSEGGLSYVSNGLILDNAYGNLVFVYGAIPAAVFLLACAGVLFRARKTHACGIEVISLLVMLLFGFSEACPLCFAYNYPLVVIASLLYSLPLSPSLEKGEQGERDDQREQREQREQGEQGERR